MPSEQFSCWICKPEALRTMRRRLPGYETGNRSALTPKMKVRVCLCPGVGWGWQGKSPRTGVCLRDESWTGGIHLSRWERVPSDGPACSRLPGFFAPLPGFFATVHGMVTDFASFFFQRR